MLDDKTGFPGAVAAATSRARLGHRELCSEFGYEHEREREQGDADVADFCIGYCTFGVFFS
jgi:hypothetical protein